MSAHCLNCQTTLQGSYCHACGQKASTHRMTFSKFLQHDLMHGIFHLDKGILYTLKSLVYQPGRAAKNFIAGKRIKHYNIFALFIIVVALKTLVDLQRAPGNLFTSYTEQTRHSDEIINETVHHYYKIFYLLIIPMLSVFSKLFLKKLDYNFVEHLVLNCFLLAGGFFYSLLLSIIGYVTNTGFGPAYFLIILIYAAIGYYQACKGIYSFGGYLWRTLSILILFMISLLIVFIIIIEIFYDGFFNGRLSF